MKCAPRALVLTKEVESIGPGDAARRAILTARDSKLNLVLKLGRCLDDNVESAACLSRFYQEVNIMHIERAAHLSTDENSPEVGTSQDLEEELHRQIYEHGHVRGL